MDMNSEKKKSSFFLNYSVGLLTLCGLFLLEQCSKEYFPF